MPVVELIVHKVKCINAIKCSFKVECTCYMLDLEVLLFI